MNYFQAKIRSIKKLGYNTPILVPSFSSKGFPNISQLHQYLKDKLTDSSLVSLYDIYYDHLDINKIYESELVFVDSGGYERNHEHDISDIYGSHYIPKEWNENLYEGLINALNPITDIVLINFDYIERFPLQEQIQKAKAVFEKHPEFANDFLLKPTIRSQDQFINFSEFIMNVDEIKQFDIIGVTEKEMGESIFTRALNLYKLRQTLTENDIHIPIHVFGCIDPLPVVLYFLCGADIFDGLSWLRFSFTNGVPQYINHSTITSGNWDKYDNEARVINYSDNLEELSKLKSHLTKFANTSDWHDLGVEKKNYNQLHSILKMVYEKL